MDDGHEAVVHARSTARLAAVVDILERGATGVVGDLADHDQVLGLVKQANTLGPVDALIHNNAGIIDGTGLLAVNLVAGQDQVLALRPNHPD